MRLMDKLLCMSLGTFLRCQLQVDSGDVAQRNFGQNRTPCLRVRLSLGFAAFWSAYVPWGIVLQIAYEAGEWSRVRGCGLACRVSRAKAFGCSALQPYQESQPFRYNYVEMARVTGTPINFLLNRGQMIKVQISGRIWGEIGLGLSGPCFHNRLRLSCGGLVPGPWRPFMEKTCCHSLGFHGQAMLFSGLRAQLWFQAAFPFTPVKRRLMRRTANPWMPTGPY